MFTTLHFYERTCKELLSLVKSLEFVIGVLGPYALQFEQKRRVILEFTTIYKPRWVFQRFITWLFIYLFIYY